MVIAIIKGYESCKILRHVIVKFLVLFPLTRPLRSFSYRTSVVSPRRPLHLAYLHVEREVLDGDHAARSEYSVGEPRHSAVRRHDRVRVDDGVVVVGIRAVRLELLLRGIAIQCKKFQTVI